MISPWIDDDAAPAPPGPDALPPRADVVVVGAGLAGAATACFLAAAGVDVLLLEARERVGAGEAGRAPGHALTGLIEHPYRVLHALGEARARAFYDFSRENQDLAATLGLLERTGSWWAATDDREPAQIAWSVQALRRLGIPAELHDDPNAALGGRGFTAAFSVPGDGFVEPHRGVVDLVARAVDRGARCCTHAPVEGIRIDHRGAVVSVIGRELPCEVVVVAAGARSDTVDGWFEHKVTPVREQGLITAPAARLPVPGGRAGYGYTAWRQLGDGRVVGAGCRWATPHLEVGEREEKVVDVIQARIEAFLRRHLGVEAAVEGRWSWIAGHGCDGLPIVGPLPGNPRVVACVGFGGNEAGLAVRAARGVVDGLLGAGPPLPPFLAASRFL